MKPVVRTRLPFLGVSLLSFSLSACGGDGGGTEPDPDPGQVQVTVMTDGAPEAGVPVSLFDGAGGAALSTATTGGSGQATFTGLEAGGYEVEVDPPAGLTLSQGEMARKTVTVTAGSTASLSFALTEDGGGPGGEVVEVILTQSLTFSPSQVTISPGTTVRWRNGSNMFHTITPDGHSEWSAVSMNQADEIFEHTFQDAGSYPYYCEPHLAFGMTGTITVQ